VNRLGSTLGTIWRLAIPYFKSEDRWPGRALFATLVAIELTLVGIQVLLNQWNARFYNAIQEYDWNTFVQQLLIYCVLAAIYITIRVYQLYLNQWLQIRWRQWMTSRYLSQWLDAATHYRMQLLGERADNPDQRIAEDIHQFAEHTLTIIVGLLGALVSLASFVVILWGLSDQTPLQLFGRQWQIPGYLVWCALLYAVFGTIITHLVGQPLIGLNFNQQRFEADFRFNLVRVREHAEQIALMRGESAERQRLMDRFGNVVRNWWRIMTRTKRLTFFTFGYTQISLVFPFVVLAPAFFANHLPLGLLTQTAAAFVAVQTALSFFITVYRTFAEWRAVIERLVGFEAAIAKSRALAAADSSITVSTQDKTSDLQVSDLDVKLPTGESLVGASDLTIPPKDHTLVTGASGAGKSTLFRAIGGIWPFGSGAVVMPEGARVMVLPQKPYFPVGSLEAAVSYPAIPGTFDEQTVQKVLQAVDLPALASRIKEDAHWERILSPGEQQRLAIARAILQAPDFLLLDEATASVSEAGEAELYRLIHKQLPHTTIISIGHRSTLHNFHQRHLTVQTDGDRAQLREGTLAPAQ
jgi:putative ATP-binding cassette transporter